MDTTDMVVERCSGNVFAGLGLPDANAHLANPEQESRIDDIVRERRITQAEVARLLGASEPDVSRLAGTAKAVVDGQALEAIPIMEYVWEGTNRVQLNEELQRGHA